MEEYSHASSLSGHLRYAGVFKMMLTKLVSTREASEISVSEGILVGIVLIGCGWVIAMDKDVDEIPDALEGLVVELYSWTRLRFTGRGSISADQGVDSMFQSHLCKDRQGRSR